MNNTKTGLVDDLNKLIRILERQDPNMEEIKWIEQIKNKAEKGYYHDFESPVPTPEIQLVTDLEAIPLKDTHNIAEKVRLGKYDE